MINNITKAVTELEKALLKASDITYDGIDRLMRKIMKAHDVTAKQLHFGFTKKHNKTPDDWIKMKRKINEDHKENKSGKFKDEEGSMARVELDTIEKSVKELRKSIKSGDQQLPAWVQSKITRAADYINTASNYMSSDEGLEEGTSFEINAKKHKPISKASRLKQELKTDELQHLPPELRKDVLLPKFSGKAEESVTEKVLNSLFEEEEECTCHKEAPTEKEKGYVKKSKPVMSVQEIADKHNVSVARIQSQLKMGIKVEGEHTKDKEEAEGIALQHLAEKPNYYTELKKVEKVQTESTIVTDLLGNPKFEFIDLVKPYTLEEVRKMKGKDPCWSGYEMIGKKKKNGRTVPNCVPKKKKLSEATLPVQNGQVMHILFSWRGKVMASQLFFPQIRIPNRREVADAIVKVYPDAKVLSYRVGSQNVGQPIIQLSNSPSKNYLLHNKTIGEEYEMLDEAGPSLSVSRGEKLSVARGGGLTAKGRAKYNRATGSHLKAPVTGKVKRGSKAWKRRKNFCSRSRSWKGPRGLAARRRWKC